MTGRLKSIAVYCGHQFGTNPDFAMRHKLVNSWAKTIFVWFLVVAMLA